MKIFLRYFDILSFHTKLSKILDIFYTYRTSHSGLATLCYEEVFKSYMWLVVAILDSYRVFICALRSLHYLCYKEGSPIQDTDCALSSYL